MCSIVGWISGVIRSINPTQCTSRKSHFTFLLACGCEVIHKIHNTVKLIFNVFDYIHRFLATANANAAHITILSVCLSVYLYPFCPLLKNLKATHT